MSVANRASQVENLLARPDAERLREFKYRFSQAAVFGLPVIALEVWGRHLGGVEAQRWVGILQALLAGWVVYVAAAGMLVEGILVRTARFLPDALVAGVAVVAYLFSAVSVAHVFIDGKLWYRTLLFAPVVGLLGLWTGMQWFVWSRRVRSAAA